MKIHKVTTVSGILLALATFSVLAGPGHHGEHKGKFMQFFDTNHDDIVTQNEFNAASTLRFDKMDADNDGVVKKEEFRDYVKMRRQEHREEKFRRIDSNQDGQISRDEFLDHKRQRAEKKFNSVDINEDGIVTEDEFSSRKGRRHGGKHDHNYGGKGHHKGKKGHHGGARFFSRLDSNDDGQVTRDESTGAWSGWFKRIDANKDGTVTIDEVRSYRHNKMEQRHGMAHQDISR